MRLKSIASHLRPYRMLARRRTTINHAFAAAIAPSDTYDERKVAEAVKLLGQNPDEDLLCAYCGTAAETWDHVVATVQESRFSGHGHRIGNLLPCCKVCNSRKGNRPWSAHLADLPLERGTHVDRHRVIERYLSAYAVTDSIPAASSDLKRLNDIQAQILALLREGDVIADRVRAAQADVGSEQALKEASSASGNLPG